MEQAPDIRRAGHAEDPGNGAGQPQRAALGLTLAQFLGAQAHPELCAAGEPAGEWNCRCAHQAQRLICLACQIGTGRALLQMRGKPFAFGL
ncbi:MAG: hypothetical protein DMG56_13640 [Acidobacteria bacterium]|nr:MAG: hypothetical protein DMG56_13640 [Acidobacteriota bacterium]